MSLKGEAKARARQLAEAKRAARRAEANEVARRKQVSAGLDADVQRGRAADVPPEPEPEPVPEPVPEPEPVPAPEPVPEPRAPRAHGSARAARIVRWIGPVVIVIALVLALGALLVALGGKPVSAFDALAPVCHLLVAGVGTTAATSTTLVTWGIGALIWLAVGFVLQSLLTRWLRV